MRVPVDCLLVVDSWIITAVVAPNVYKVVNETDKMVEITALDATGQFINPHNTRSIRKTSIIAIIDSMEEFQPYHEMNQQISALHSAYANALRSGENKVNQVKKEFQAKLQK